MYIKYLQEIFKNNIIIHNSLYGECYIQHTDKKIFISKDTLSNLYYESIIYRCNDVPELEQTHFMLSSDILYADGNVKLSIANDVSSELIKIRRDFILDKLL